MSNDETLVGAFGALVAIGPLRQRWVSTSWLAIAQAQDDLAEDEQTIAVAIGEDRHSDLQGIVLTDRRLGVIGAHGTRWHSRDEVWEVSGIAAAPVAGEVLNVYGSDWEHTWSQVRPLGAAPVMERSLRQQLRRKQAGASLRR